MSSLYIMYIVLFLAVLFSRNISSRTTPYNTGFGFKIMNIAILNCRTVIHFDKL